MSALNDSKTWLESIVESRFFKSTFNNFAYNINKFNLSGNEFQL